MTVIALLGTCDTKLHELLFLRDAIQQSNPNIQVSLIDVGRHSARHEAISISQNDLLQRYGDVQEIANLPRGEFIEAIAKVATEAIQDLFEQGNLHAIIAAGGSSGTSLAAAVMRDALPIGFPKLIVSTIASGDTGSIVGETDITLMYSVVDVAGLNPLLRNVLRNAGAAIAGMAQSYASRKDVTITTKKRIGITMFGVTTPAVDAIRRHLEANYEVETYIFHATGHGGKAMERLVREGGLDAVLDLTTTEICDHITGGVMSAGPTRLQAAAKAGIPNILSVGATDMTNFGPKSTVPEKYKNRKLYVHNPEVTLMRTSKEEAKAVGDFIVHQLESHTTDTNMVEIWLPKSGISMIATPDGPFADPEADAALFKSIKSVNGIKVVEDERAINDPGFARDIAEALVLKMGLKTI